MVFTMPAVIKHGLWRHNPMALLALTLCVLVNSTFASVVWDDNQTQLFRSINQKDGSARPNETMLLVTSGSASSTGTTVANAAEVTYPTALQSGKGKNPNEPSNTEWMFNSTSTKLTLSAVVLLSFVVIIFNSLCILVVTRKSGWRTRFTDLLTFQIYVADVGVCMYALENSVVYLVPKYSNGLNLALSLIDETFPMVVMFSTTLIATFRCRAICRTTVSPIRGVLLYLLVVGCWILAVSISLTLSIIDYYTERGPQKAPDVKEFVMVIIVVATYTIPAVMNVVLYIVSFLALRRATKNSAVSEVMVQRRKQNRVAARRLVCGGLLGLMFGIPSWFLLFVNSMTVTPEKKFIWWRWTTYIQVFFYLLVALVNPFIHCGFKEMFSGIRSLKKTVSSLSIPFSGHSSTFVESK